MEAVVRLVDESPTGERTNGLVLRLVGQRITVRDLIRRRVETETTLHNARRAPPGFAWRTLVIPSSSEAEPTPADPERLVRLAYEAFRRNGFFVLLGDQQLANLDDEVQLTGDDTVSFLRLMPLLG